MCAAADNLSAPSPGLWSAESEASAEVLVLTRPPATDSAGVFAILGDSRTVEHDPSDRLEDHGADGLDWAFTSSEIH
ncbi:MAG: hypothetical protein Q8O61_11545 [Nocardioides sp.]|nr:hypothetical protein [Nocardioides sp.]